MVGARERRPPTRGPGFVLTGEPGFRLELSVSGYEFPDIRSGADADWLICSVELREGDRVRARIENDPFFEGRDLEAFRDELRKLLDGRSDHAVLAGIEDMVTLDLKRDDQRLSVTAAITDHGDLDVELDGFTVEVGALECLAVDLERMLDEFPSRPERVERRVSVPLPRPSLGDFLRRRDR